MKVFGPVPSRRLGMSLGINNIPPKFCTYSCVYCQVGRTTRMISERQNFFSPEDLFEEVSEKIKQIENNSENIDYFTIVSDGEPTLDINFGKLIDLLHQFDIPVAVITNSSLINISEVRTDLLKADWVSVKVDTVNVDIWHKIDRAHKQLKFKAILKGILKFSEEFSGKLYTETMLVENLNVGNMDIENLASFIKKINPLISYVSVPIRPPAEKWVKIPDEQILSMVYQVFSSMNLEVEFLTGYEGNKFAYTGDVEEDLLSITSVHPMREDAVFEYLKKSNSQFSKVESLINQNKLVVSEYNGKKFYFRNLFFQEK
ncbi:radical SAM protein [bacterium]|nr:radical SAM protein [bacterium]